MDCRSILGLRDNARMLSIEIFFKGGKKVGYGVLN